MLRLSERPAAEIEQSANAHENRDLLRFLTCGSVDDGKSTLIGRLLYDSQLLFEDQLAALEEESRKLGKTNGGLDFALLVDGLLAEREQGITIDVAYRFFSTDRRKFIVADTPGHEQYTRNMATGASTAELAVILVDARKGVLTQTRRHGYIASLLGIKHVVLAVNKMDLVGYSGDVFEAITEDYRLFAAQLGFEDTMCIPVSALKGDNVFVKSADMAWYAGPTLMKYLETVDVRSNRREAGFRMPVQWVNRPDSDFRGYSGTVVSGSVMPGDRVIVASSGRTTRIARIVSPDGDLDQAVAGQPVTLTLEDELDISRGDIIANEECRPETTDQIQAHVLWMHGEHMLPGRTYELKIGAQTAIATVSDLKYTVNVNNLEQMAGKVLELNEVGVCNISIDRAISFDPYAESRETGAFLLIDRFSKNTVGAGMIDFGLRRATNLVWQDLQIDKQARAGLKNQKPCVLWFTGLSGSGKSTIANAVEKRLHALGCHTFILDGDNVRHGLNRDLGFTDVDRVENIRRISEVAKLFIEAGLIVMVAFIAPFRSERRMARELLEEGEFLEVFVDTPLDVCEDRDPKGLYRKAREGKIANFTGVDSRYEVPVNPELRLETVTVPLDESAEQIVQTLRERGIVG